MSDPHWLVQELAGNAAWTAVGVGAAYAWKYRDTIVRRFANPANAVYLKGAESDEQVGTLVAISAHSGGSGGSYATAEVGSRRPRLERVADELLKLSLCYIHQL